TCIFLLSLHDALPISVFAHVPLLSYNSEPLVPDGEHRGNQYYRLTIVIEEVIHNRNYRPQMLLRNSIQTRFQNKSLQMYVEYKITKFRGKQQCIRKYHEQTEMLSNIKKIRL